jgi:parallel beta-helix repeat protein
MTQFHGLAAVTFLFVTTFFLNTGQAATIYVDKDNPCPGSGTSSSPYCSIQTAFNNVSAGDQILIRDASSAYDENAILTTSGTSSTPIIITKDTGHNPNITYAGAGAQTGAIVLKNVSNVTIRDLRFDGVGVQTSRNAINIANTAGSPMVGIKITGITCSNWGGTGVTTLQAACIRTTSDDPTYTISLSLLDSTFTGNRFSSIRLSYSKNTVVEGNTIRNQKCGLASEGYAHWAAIKIGGDSTGMTVRNNRIENFQTYADCIADIAPPNTTAMIMAAIYCDTGGNSGTIDQNTISTLNYPNTFPFGDSVGIFLESRCSNWTVSKNVIYNVGHKGIRNGSSGTGDPNNNTYINNTFANIGFRGIWIRRGANHTIKNNIVYVNPSAVPIEINATAATQGGHKIDYNLYWDTQSGAKVGLWADSTTRNLFNWRQECACDTQGLSKNPLFLSLVPGSEDFRLSSSSPARGAGQGGVDLGAYLSLTTPNAPNKLNVMP